MITKVTKSDFEEKVISSKTPTLIDFYADWCGPCKMAEPILEELSTTYAGKVTFVKVNVDEESELAGKYDVMSIPTTILIKNGIEVGRQIGFGGKEQFETLIKKGGE